MAVWWVYGEATQAQSDTTLERDRREASADQYAALVACPKTRQGYRQSQGSCIVAVEAPTRRVLQLESKGEPHVDAADKRLQLAAFEWICARAA